MYNLYLYYLNKKWSTKEERILDKILCKCIEIWISFQRTLKVECFVVTVLTMKVVECTRKEK